MRDVRFWPALVCASVLGCASTPSPAVGPAQDPADESPAADASASPAAAVGEWLADRGRDLVDVASLRVALGPGLLVHARATPWIAAGWGMLGRSEAWAGGFEMKVYRVGWSGRTGGVWTERRAEMGLSSFYYCEAEPTVLAGTIDVFPPEDRRTFDIGAELHLALVGAAAEVRPDEALDFVLGLFGVDLLDDDA